MCLGRKWILNLNVEEITTYLILQACLNQNLKMITKHQIQEIQKKIKKTKILINTHHKINLANKTLSISKYFKIKSIKFSYRN